jgi:dynein heavy chain
VFEITLTRGYDEAAFREDIKRLYALLGADNKRVVFLFTDAHVADESFLELVNNMLTSGQRGPGMGAHQGRGGGRSAALIWAVTALSS